MSFLNKYNQSSFGQSKIGLYLKVVAREIRNEWGYVIGKNNKTIKHKSVTFKCKKQIFGNNNRIILDEGVICRRVLFHIDGNDNLIHIHEHSNLSGCELYIEDSHCKIEIGKHVALSEHDHFAVTENGSEITIGDHTGCSAYVQMRTGDSHVIYDKNGKRVNKAGSIHIGNHCWIGHGARILKRVSLGDNVTVGTGSVVISSFGSDVTLMGFPAFPVNFNTIHPDTDRNAE